LAPPCTHQPDSSSSTSSLTDMSSVRLVSTNPNLSPLFFVFGLTYLCQQTTYVVDFGSETVDYAMGRIGTGQCSRASLPKFHTLITIVLSRAEVSSHPRLFGVHPARTPAPLYPRTRTGRCVQPFSGTRTQDGSSARLWTC
jgi:hypothetical protein